jgi:hypothetical protein
MSEPLHDPSLTAVEAALASLTPAAGSISRDALLFRAGQASIRRRWFWPSATAVLGTVSAALAAVMLWSPVRQSLQEVHFVRIEVPSAPRLADRAAGSVPDTGMVARADDQRGFSEYQVLQRQLLRWGLDAIPNRYPPTRTQAMSDMEAVPGVRPIDRSTPRWQWINLFFGSGDRS